MRQASLENKDKDFIGGIARLHPLLMREFARRQRNILSRGLVTLPQVIALDLLSERPFCKMNELAAALGLTMSAATALVDKMIEVKLVKRQRSQQDRRVVQVFLLNKGKQLWARINQARKSMIDELFSPLSETEKKEYMLLLRKIYESIRQRNEKL